MASWVDGAAPKRGPRVGGERQDWEGKKEGDEVERGEPEREWWKKEEKDEGKNFGKAPDVKRKKGGI